MIAKLPQLETLDGKDVTKSSRILSLQQLPQLQADLAALAGKKRAEKQAKNDSLGITLEQSANDFEDDEEGEKLTSNTPEARVEIYKELAAQKKEKEDRSKVNMPKERNYEKEQRETLEKIRGVESKTGSTSIHLSRSFIYL